MGATAVAQSRLKRPFDYGTNGTLSSQLSARPGNAMAGNMSMPAFTLPSMSQPQMGSAPSPINYGGSLFSGSMTSYPSMPGDVSGLRGGEIGSLTGQVGQTSTQPIDQLGGVNSPFFQNILSQITPLFDQQRNKALASAKESAGNLTGSGFANALGNSMNQLIPQQQAQTADLFTKAMQMETDRQSGDANRLAQLLQSFGNTGVGPNELTHTGGIESMIPGISSIIGQLLGKGSGGGNSLDSVQSMINGLDISKLVPSAGSLLDGIPGGGAASSFLGSIGSGINSGETAILNKLGLGSLTSLPGFSALGPAGIALAIMNMFPKKTAVGSVGRMPGKAFSWLGHRLGL